MEKKNLAIIVLAIFLAASGIGNIILGIQLGAVDLVPPPKETLIIGTGSGPRDLDPADSWDSASNDVIMQVAETLFFNNLSHPDMPLTNWLAESYTWENTTVLEITLRTGVKFHDGTVFDADAAIWNFERLYYLMNHTGDLAEGTPRAQIHSLYEFSDGSPVFKSFTKISEYVIQIELYGPFTPILAAMSYVSCSMLSPASTPEKEYLNTATDDLVGTGPYDYVEYVTDDYVLFTRFDDYWMEPVMFDELIFNVMEDSSTRNYAMLAGDIDYLWGSIPDLWDTFNESESITFRPSEKPGLAYYYLGINNNLINRTWRKAISYAINYTYILEEYWLGAHVKSYGPVSPGYSLYYDDLSDVAPYCNLTIARQTLIDDPGIDTTGLTANDDPDDVDWLAANFRSLNYTGNSDNAYRADMLPVLVKWLDKIGITVTDGLCTWARFLYLLYGQHPFGYDALELYMVGWGPDYLDPMNMIQPLFSNISGSNTAQVNDPLLEEYIEAYMLQPNELIRIEIIKNISLYLCTELYPHAFTFHPQSYSIHAADLYNVAYNVAGNQWLYPIKRDLDWTP